MQQVSQGRVWSVLLVSKCCYCVSGVKWYRALVPKVVSRSHPPFKFLLIQLESVIGSTTANLLKGRGTHVTQIREMTLHVFGGLHLLHR